MRIATLNLRNTADRWPERRTLLVRQLIDLAPDVIGLQEARTVPDQAGWIARRVARVSGSRLEYRCYRRPKLGHRGLWEGLATLTRIPVAATAWISLGSQARVAQRLTVRPPEGGLLDFYNTHLGLGGEVLRSAQAQILLDWMARRPPVPVVLVGDLNARPGSPTLERLSTRLRSAHGVLHGREVAHTVPTPLRVGWTGAYSILDWILVSEQVDVSEARLAFDEVDPSDPTLAVSDHYGLTAVVAARRT